MAKKNEPDKDNFRYALRGHKIPILTLDTRWHALFQRRGKNATIRSLEKELNALLKKQGKLVNDNKDMKKLKKRLMKEIVDNMESTEEGKGTPLQEKKLETSQKLILDINDKMKDADQSLLDIPYEIEKVNRELMIEGMQSCYEELQENEDRIEQLQEEIKDISEKLKNVILEKQDREESNEKIYALMHAILGPGVMEILDRKQGLTRKDRNVLEAEKKAEAEMLKEANRATGGTKGKDEKKNKESGIFTKWIKKKEDGADGDLEAMELDLPQGTGNRIIQPRRGASRKENSSESGNNYSYSGREVKKGKTVVQQYEEQEKKKANFIRELEAYERELKLQEKKEKQKSIEKEKSAEDNFDVPDVSVAELAAARERERQKRKEEIRRRREKHS